MMKSKKSFKDLAKQISALQENQLGKLKGGFSSFSVETEKAKVGNNNNTNNASSCSCSCNSGCSGSIIR